VLGTVAVTGTVLLLGFGAGFALALRDPGFASFGVWSHALERSAACAALGLAALLVCWRRSRDPGWCLVAAAISLAAVAWLEAARLVEPARVHLVASAAVLAVLVVFQRARGVSRVSFGTVWAMGAALLVAALALVPAFRYSTNRLGLISGAPRSVSTRDYASNPSKDDYPRCTFTNNSLGYRDVEPAAPLPARRRVLIVGDSFVWGDGIPTAQGTLPALLRARLEARAPGAWDVVSAAYPGLGVYGYRRSVERLAPEVQPHVVVVGYLGSADLDPLDSQALRDLLPASRWLAAVALNLGVVQSLHEASSAAPPGQPALVRWRTGQGARWRDALFSTLAGLARGPGKRSILLCYAGAEPGVPGVDQISLPARWRYQGHRSEYWYAKDCHPKPLLNELLAEQLAEEIVRPGSWQERFGADTGSPDVAGSSAPPEREGPVIPPGQETLVLDMLGGASGVDGCRVRHAAVEKTQIRATFECDSGATRGVVLAHPAKAEPGAVVTNRFALSAWAAETPTAFVTQVAAGVRAREGQFQWKEPPTRTGEHEPSRSPSAPVRPWIPWRPVVALAGAVLIAAWSWRRPAVAVQRAARGGEQVA
jgi:hypothetical protein